MVRMPVQLGIVSNDLALVLSACLLWLVACKLVCAWLIRCIAVAAVPCAALQAGERVPVAYQGLPFDWHLRPALQSRVNSTQRAPLQTVSACDSSF